MTAALYLDEDSSDRRLIAALRRAHVDVLTAKEAGMLGRKDAEHLEVAVDQTRVLITKNGRDFWQIHTQWMAEGRNHFGIVIIPPKETLTVGERMRRVVGLSESLRHSPIEDQVVYLNAQWLGLR